MIKCNFFPKIFCIALHKFERKKTFCIYKTIIKISNTEKKQ